MRKILVFGFALALVALTGVSAQGGMNNDGAADIVYSNYPAYGEELSCISDAAGGFTCTNFNERDGNVHGYTAQGLDVGDLDGDGDIDVVVASDMNINRTCLNDGNGSTFVCTDGPSPTLTAFDVALGDIDGDDDLDAVMANFGHNQVCLNDGAGVFSPCSDIGAGHHEAFNVALGDLDRNGTLDAVFSNSDDPHQVCSGDGTGAFTCADLSVSGTNFNGVALGDIDLDDDLDAVFSDAGRNLLCLGDGTGSLDCTTASRRPPPVTYNYVDDEYHRAYGVALGDINNDGNLDAVFAGSNAPSRVCLGDGTGLFACDSLTVGTSRMFDVDVGDVDGDGFLDVAFADSGGPNPVCYGDGTGNFPTCEMVNADTNQTTGVRIVLPPIAPNEPPVITEVSGPDEPVLINSETGVLATFADPNTDDSHTATVNWGDDTATAATVDFDAGSGTAMATHTYTEPGVYTVTVTVTDGGGLADSGEYRYVVVYDPDGGFVTGGGWIDSPPGAYTPDPELDGKANFGFVSKYKNGATVPTGNTQFQFQTGDLNFHSSSYDWLVVTGSDYAKFKGTGTINGTGEYKFKIWAGDADPNTFRIKIWTEEGGIETAVYDNGMDQEIGGGNIIVHTKKK